MMQELKYIRCGHYYIPDIRLPEENRPIGRWGRMHRDYIKEHNPNPDFIRCVRDWNIDNGCLNYDFPHCYYLV